MPSSRLLIFVKNPVLGRVKTRLAADIGEQPALELYLSLMKHTFLEASKFARQFAPANTKVAVYFSETLPERSAFPVALSPDFRLCRQEGENLGQRMNNAFCEGFAAGFQKQVIIGSDCPQLTAGHLAQAFNALSISDTVIGPARDGGYYLLGMSQPQPGLFDLAAWSHGDVFVQTLARIRKAGLSYTQTEELSDVDTVEDLQRLGLL